MSSPQLSQHYQQHLALEAILDWARQRPNLGLTDLAPVDQLHLGGRSATQALASKVQLDANHRLLDLGCGLGGSSRLLADHFGCQVTGLDYNPQFVRLATQLSHLFPALAKQLQFNCGDAQSLPYADASFDVIWCQHVLANIPARQQALAEMRRVLKPGGILVLHELVQGENHSALLLPVPWSSHAETSHLMVATELQDELQTLGMQQDHWQDVTSEALSWRKRAQDQSQGAQLSPSWVLGPDFASMGANLRANLEADRVRVIEAIYIHA
ncbi:class I SAM-dependent methyltransferase [Balneatrix alpica]|uniref:Class I SAM-dependent methyltransferase n=1 Tax=Balneatrix alpica TaxID=75684 RepID=A0ABV5ZAU1_9GAMM|nr:class I SAM-dependent methyltransferase [Balneatrix alpica]